MPRTYQKKTNEPVYDPRLLRQAIDAIVKNEIRFADDVKEYGIPKTTLRRHLKTPEVQPRGGIPIFNSLQEQIIKDSILYL